eukprot:TRINITY_DN3428_c0_g1_i3.p1 TRINITY_DN3428_c0_g1~~TRINITY_DN3428_c0_g1_i3.p1  ORF type:complete len:244 (-),score=57.86 TRINITY_DN3428_c0_g1_i3:449-1144(-)
MAAAALLMPQITQHNSLFYACDSTCRSKARSEARSGPASNSCCPFYTPATMEVEPTKLYAKKTGTLRVKMVRRWRESLGLRQEDVCQAVKDCACCNPSQLYPELECPQCCKGGEKVVTAEFVDCGEYVAASGMEEYIFKVVSRCSSSSNHLRTPYVVLVCLIGGVQVKSAQFMLLSREWKGRGKNKANLAGMNVDELPRRRHNRVAAAIKPPTMSLLPTSCTPSLPSQQPR